MSLQNENSYGAILYCIVEGVRYFILIGAIRNNGTVEYGFPKGHPDLQDNSILDTIIREIKEETGIPEDILLLDHFDEQQPAFSLSYEIIRKGEKLLKTSTYYPLEMKKIDLLTELEVPGDFIHEIKDIRIVAEEQVNELLSHDNEKVLWRKWVAGLRD